MCKTEYTEKYASHPCDVKNYDTAMLREEFLIENLFEEDKNGYLKKSKDGDFTRRQDVPKVWEYNGAIYIINISTIEKRSFAEFEKIRKYLMNEKSSVDVDGEMDLQYINRIINTD